MKISAILANTSMYIKKDDVNMLLSILAGVGKWEPMMMSGCLEKGLQACIFLFLSCKEKNVKGTIIEVLLRPFFLGWSRGRGGVFIFVNILIVFMEVSLFFWEKNLYKFYIFKIVTSYIDLSCFWYAPWAFLLWRL